MWSRIWSLWQNPYVANKYCSFAYFNCLFDEPLKHDTYSPYISLIICIIFYYPLAIFWAITFENPSINEEMAAIWNYAPFLVIDLAHSANFTMATIEECGLQLLEHPPYSPDLAPSDFFLFPEMKRQLKGRRFEDRNEICAVTEEWLLAQPPHFYFEGLFKVKNRWQKCISLDGGWVEK